MSEQIRIIIVDDQNIAFNGVKDVLQKEQNMCLAGCAQDSEELFEILSEQPTDLILLDYGMPGKNGFELVKIIKEKWPYKPLKIIMLSGYNEQYFIDEAKSLNIDGYVLKQHIETLIPCIKDVMEGNRHFPENTGKNETGLTKTEMKILGYIAQGFTNKQIANLTYCSLRTIETHHKNINAKLDVKSVAELIKVARDKNLI